jgi:hypothetical protein
MFAFAGWLEDYNHTCTTIEVVVTMPTNHVINHEFLNVVITAKLIRSHIHRTGSVAITRAVARTRTVAIS